MAKSEQELERNGISRATGSWHVMTSADARGSALQIFRN